MCILCGNKNVTIDEKYEPFLLIDCPNCGKYVVSEEFQMNLLENKFNKQDVIDKIKNANAERVFLGSKKAFEIYKQRNLQTNATLLELI